MRRRAYLILFLVSLAILAAATRWQRSPGYMDAEYYLVGGMQIAAGSGFQEPFIWNFLDNPQGIPHPSHTYWMPLASIISAAGIWTGIGLPFFSARLPMILAAGLISPLTAGLCWSMTRKRSFAWLGGILALAPGFYLPRLTTTDTFGPVMILGILFIQAAYWLYCSPRKFLLGEGLGLGILAGLMHLTRADGVLWLALGGLVGLAAQARHEARQRPDSVETRQPAARAASIFRIAILGLVILGGYLIVMGPWLARNLQLYGFPLSPAGGHTLWLTDYDDLYSYPSSILTPARWIASGWGSILRARWDAFIWNIQTILVVQGGIILLPLAVLGAWKLRGDIRVRLALAAGGLIGLTMTLVFPWPGARGGLFHSCAALQPLLWSLVPVGLDECIQWGKRKRGWNPTAAWKFFAGGIVVLMGLISLAAFQRQVIGEHASAPVWDQAYRETLALDSVLSDLGIGDDVIFMVNNPPGFYYATGRQAVVIPDGDIQSLLAAGRQYQARYIILDENHVGPLDSLYSDPEMAVKLSGGALEFVESIDTTHLFRRVGP